jgi:DNA-binding NtrC family response regulator
MKRVLLTDDNPSIHQLVGDIFRHTDISFRGCFSGKEAIDLFSSEEFDCVISDVSMPEVDGYKVLSEIRNMNSSVPIIMITGVGGIDDAVRAIHQGANDFVVKPFNPEEFRLRVENHLKLYGLIRENERLRSGKSRGGCASIIGRSAPVRRMVSQIRQVARSNASIMILGESGTGKELVARSIHEESDRADKPFLAVDCSTLSESIMESELFGHSKGSFTGADRNRKGIFEEANGGTIFLDEIGNLTLQTQSKLLRFLQEREIKPVGVSYPIKIDVRVVSATNADLRNSIEKKEFREDLYYRLSGIEIPVPSLKDRVSDIPVLAEYFIRKYANQDKGIISLDESAVALLSQREWKGNIRELEHLIEHAVIIERGSYITSETLSRILPESKKQSIADGGEMFSLDRAVSLFEEAHIRKVLKAAGGNRVRAAGMLDVSRSVLYEKMKRYGVE